MKKRRLTILFLLAQLLFMPSFVVMSGNTMPKAKLEERARDLGRELRCPVCQNQSIEDSDADLAGDLRLIIRQKLRRGETEKEIVAFVVARYGEFVLLEPPVNSRTILLWITPIFIFLLGAVFILFWFRRRGVTNHPILSEDEKRRLSSISNNKP